MNNNGKVSYVLSKEGTKYRGPIAHYLQYTEQTLKKASELKNKAVLSTINKILKEEDDQEDNYQDAKDS